MNKKYIIVGIILMVMGVLMAQQLLFVDKVQANVDRVRDLKEKSKVETQEDIAEELIRFHVLANSDSDSDQDIKIRVRDEVLKEVVPYLDQSQSLEETRRIIENKKQNMVDIAGKVLKENGKTYGATATLGQFSFPTKYYGEFSLPAGTYEAFRIVLGEGKGANWWCVMFPPLCFISTDEEGVQEETQETSGRVEDLIEPAANIEKEQTEGEYPEVKVRWKIVEIFQSMFK